MISTEPIRVEGLARFQRELRAMDRDLPKALRLAMNEAAQLVVDDARPHVPTRTGRAAASIRVSSTRTSVRVTAGNARAPYYPWLDFGGRVGRKKSVRRAFLKSGRYLFPAYARQRDSGAIQEALHKALLRVAHESGVAMD